MDTLEQVPAQVRLELSTLREELYTKMAGLRDLDLRRMLQSHEVSFRMRELHSSALTRIDSVETRLAARIDSLSARINSLESEMKSLRAVMLTGFAHLERRSSRTSKR